jgi:hypothetical protein
LLQADRTLRKQALLRRVKSAMANCKSCGQAMTKAAAAASVFRMSFLPVRGQIADRRQTTTLAERIGPLWLNCIETVKDMAAADDESVVQD